MFVVPPRPENTQTMKKKRRSKQDFQDLRAFAQKP